MNARADAGARLGPRIAAPPAAGVAALLVALLTTGMPARAQAPSAASAAVKLANPASRNCVAQGGSVSIESDGAGGRFGVCVFADNLQCEEWAMLRGECRNGGVKVTGYATPRLSRQVAYAIGDRRRVASLFRSTSTSRRFLLRSSRNPDARFLIPIKRGSDNDLRSLVNHKLHIAPDRVAVHILDISVCQHRF